MSCSRLFHTLTTRSAKNVDLEVQLQWRFSILFYFIIVLACLLTYLLTYLLIQFRDRILKNMIMESLSKLKEAENEFKNIIFAHDMTGMKDKNAKRS